MLNYFPRYTPIGAGVPSLSSVYFARRQFADSFFVEW